tara:strand:- start:438 stop:827 length:390 start_codon:yes stop_codon:yes gene_type:complete
MPKNLNPYSKPQGGFVTTWTVTHASTCTKALEAGKSHFITFIVCSTDNSDPADKIVVKLWEGDVDGDGLRLEVWPIEQDGTPSILNFSSPIQIAEGTKVILDSTITSGGGSADTVSLTMGGFTSDSRVF